MSCGAMAASSPSNAGRNLYDGQGRVTSLATMTADFAVAARALRRGVPMGSARARAISACSAAASGAAWPPAGGRTTPSRLAWGSVQASSPSP